MVIDEGARHRLFRRLEEVLGPDEAEVLMRHLPPVGWADVATKQDLLATRQDFANQLAATEGRLRAETHGIRAEIHGVRAEIHEVSKKDLRKMVTTIITVNTVSVAAVAGIAFAAAGLT